MKIKEKLIMIMAGVVITLSCSVLQADDSSNDKALLEDIRNLTKKIEGMEKMVNQRFNKLEGYLRQRPKPNLQSAAEAKAREALNAIVKLTKESKFDEAKTNLDEFMKIHGKSLSARSAFKLRNELQVIGKLSPEEWGIDYWFQGEKDVSLENGETTVLVFWEVWCQFCQVEMPRIEELFKYYKGTGIQVVGVTQMNQNATDEQVKEFLKDRSIEYPIARDSNGSVSKFFHVSRIPSAAVVKDGKVIWRGHSKDITDEFIVSLL